MRWSTWQTCDLPTQGLPLHWVTPIPSLLPGRTVARPKFATSSTLTLLVHVRFFRLTWGTISRVNDESDSLSVICNSGGRQVAFTPALSPGQNSSQKRLMSVILIATVEVCCTSKKNQVIHPVMI